MSDVTPLLALEHLRTLNIAQCPLEGRVGTLAGCCNLVSLSLSNLPVDCTELMELSSELQNRTLQYDLDGYF